MDKLPKCVTRGHWDARPTVTFPAAGRHRLTLYCIVTEAHVNNLPKVVSWMRDGRELNPQPFESRVQHPNRYITRPT